MKKRILIALLSAMLLLTGCGRKTYSIVASTAPLQQFAAAVCEGTPLEVGRVVTDSVSCIHDYSLSTDQMILLDRADVVILTGTDLEAFLTDALSGEETVITCSEGVPLLELTEEDEPDGNGDETEYDPHIWLSPANAAIMTRNIAEGLSELYPEYAETFRTNAEAYCDRLAELQTECEAQLENLSSRGLITFHDGFAYFAEAFDLQILAAIEEESGSEASAKELKSMIGLVRDHGVPCVFVEQDGSVSAAQVIAAETGCGVYTLSTGLSGADYFDVIRGNVAAVEEGLK